MPPKKEETQKGINYRAAIITRGDGAPSTLDENTRSVDIVLSTEAPARVYSWDRGPIDEVLLMSGAQIPSSRQLVMLDAHSRWGTSDIIGSARDVRVDGDKMLGRAYFSSVAEAEGPWTKLREGHLTDFSVGYRVDEAVWIPENQSATIDGRTYTGPLQVVTQWTPREISAVPIGADPNAKARADINKPNNKEEEKMNPQVRALLEKKGLPATATDEEAIAFLAQLEAKSETPSETDQERAAAEDKIRKEATGKERDRIREIDAICAKYDCGDMARSLILDGTTVIEAQRKVLDAVMERSKKQNPGAGVEDVADARDKFRAAAEHGLILRAGMKIEKPAPGAEELRGFTLVEMARECLRANNLPHRGSVKEMVGRALTTDDFPNILANLATKSMQQGWDDAQETWPIWTGEGSVSDFKTYYDNGLGELDDLELIPDSGEIKMGSFSEKTPETYKIASYGKKFKITRVMIINDDLNALTALPAKRTEAANRKIGDIVYAILTANGNMGDGYPIFSATYHSNDEDTSALLDEPGINNIAAGILAMGTHKDISGKRRLNIRPQYYLAPKALEGVSEVFFRSDKFSDPNTVATDSSFASTRVNPYAGNYFTRIYEPRLDDESSAAWYLLGPKGKTVKVMFLNGQRGPILEMIQPGFSVEGFEYAVVIDVGAYAVDYRGMFRNDGE